MRNKILLFSLLFFLLANNLLIAQRDLSGVYGVTGYFFHPTLPRSINISKAVTQVGPRTYYVNLLGDLPGWGFQFTLDGSNHLTNWIATGYTYPAPASGFMTTDNPGGFAYSGPPYPGTSPWLQSTYNNTYDPATHTFYMHYGYNSLATNQNSYDRQIYEKYVLEPPPKIGSVIPLTATALTDITIKGRNFSLVNPFSNSIYFGDKLADTAYIISDTKLIARVGSGASGNVTVINKNYSSDTFPGFTYIPVPTVSNPGWNYVGNAGVTQNSINYVSMACANNNDLYVAYVDSVSKKTKVIKYNGVKWIAVGSDVSDGKSSFTNIVLTTSNIPIVAYIDSANGNRVTVKKFISKTWQTLGNAGFVESHIYKQTPFSLSISNNLPYILSVYFGGLSIYKFIDNNWIVVGNKNFAHSFDGAANMDIDKKSNFPYVVFNDSNNATVMKFDGNYWGTVGNNRFTDRNSVIAYPDIKIDTAGIPIVALQDNNSFERESVYKFNGSWINIGSPRFSKGRSYFSSLVLDKKNNPYVLFSDDSYNNQGTVRKFLMSTQKWDTIGARGFLPYSGFFGRNCLVIDSANTPIVAFPDKNNGGKLSVMKFGGANITNDQQPSTENIIAKTQTGFNIFPNPAHNALTISFNADKSTSLIQILNEKGQVIMQKNISAIKGINNVSIDIGKIPPGAYIFLLKTGDETLSKQFLKQ